MWVKFFAPCKDPLRDYFAILVAETVAGALGTFLRNHIFVRNAPNSDLSDFTFLRMVLTPDGTILFCILFWNTLKGLPLLNTFDSFSMAWLTTFGGCMLYFVLCMSCMHAPSGLTKLETCMRYMTTKYLHGYLEIHVKNLKLLGYKTIS